MATKFAPQHVEVRSARARRGKRHLTVVVTADDMRREHEDALRSGPAHPGYERARYLIVSAKNASENFCDSTVEELMQVTFEARAESYNRQLGSN